MVKKINKKGGTSIEDLNAFIEKVKNNIKYHDHDDASTLKQKIKDLKEADISYAKLLNTTNVLNVSDSTLVSEYIQYTQDTPYQIQLYMKQFIQRLFEVEEIYTNITKAFKTSNITKYIDGKSNSSNLYFYVICPIKDKFTLITELNKLYIVDQDKNNKYLELKLYLSGDARSINSYLIIAKIFILENAPSQFTNDNDTILFMNIYQKSINPYVLNVNLDKLIENLLETYKEDAAKIELLQKYAGSDTIYNNTYIYLINYLYPKYHNTIQNELTALLEKDILDLCINIQSELTSTTSKIVLIGGASFNIVSNIDNKNESINDFDFAIYYKNDSDSKNLLDMLIAKCKAFKSAKVLSSNTKKPSRKIITHNYDISKVTYNVREDIRNKRISIDINILESYTINEQIFTNTLILPIVDINIKQIDENIYNNISTSCQLLLDGKDYALINILSRDGLLYNINNTEITKRPLIKQRKDKLRWQNLLDTKNKEIYTYNLRVVKNKIEKAKEAALSAMSYVKESKLKAEQAKKEAEDRARKETEELSRKEAEERIRLEAEERIRLEHEERTRKEARRTAKKSRNAEERAKKVAEKQIKENTEQKVHAIQTVTTRTVTKKNSSDSQPKEQTIIKKDSSSPKEQNSQRNKSFIARLSKYFGLK